MSSNSKIFCLFDEQVGKQEIAIIVRNESLRTEKSITKIFIFSINRNIV